MEFLPVYTPSKAESSDPMLFARNVRGVMAEALGIDTVELGLDDAKVRARPHMRLTFAFAPLHLRKQKVCQRRSDESKPEEEEEKRRRKKSSFAIVLENDLDLDLDLDEDYRFEPGKKGYNYVDLAGSVNLM